MAYNIGDTRVFYSREHRDEKANKLEKMGYHIKRYDGLTNYFFKVLDVPDRF
jgi:hypothetical protein